MPKTPFWKPRKSVKWWAIAGTATVVLLIIGAVAGNKNPAPIAATTPPTAAPSAAASTAAATAAPTAPPTAVPAPEVTTGQANAADEAAQYLSEGNGWSRAGLIAQLDSPYGGQYSKADATYGVDSQGVDWNAQAVLAAKAYLATSPFSRNALIAQLDSPYGGQFTMAQAVYGVDHSGL